MFKNKKNYQAELDSLHQEIEKAPEYQDIKKYEGHIVKQWKITVLLISLLCFLFLLFTFIALYQGYQHTRVVFLVLLIIAGCMVVFIIGVFLWIKYKQRHIASALRNLLKPSFWKKIYTFYLESIESTIKINSVTTEPEVKFSLNLTNNYRIYENYINGEYKGIKFSIGSFLENSNRVKYRNKDTTSLLLHDHNYYRYVTLSYNMKTMVPSNQTFTIRHNREPKQHLLTNMRFSDLYNTNHPELLTTNTKRQIIYLMHQTGYLPAFKIKNNNQVLTMKAIDIASLEDHTGMFGSLTFEKEYEILSEIHTTTIADCQELAKILNWIQNYCPR